MRSTVSGNHRIGLTAQEHKKQAEVVRQFLIAPLSRDCFDRFFGLCVGETRSYLRWLKASGWRLPLDQVQTEHPFDDITFDVLGFFLASRKERPFEVIFDYFHRHGISDFAALGSDDLIVHFLTLLRGYIRRRITKLAGESAPEIALLKRRVAEVLGSPEYRRARLHGDTGESVYLAENEHRLREELPVLPQDLLQRLVLDAFLKCANRSDWCAGVFGLLDLEHGYRNAIPREMLLGTMIAINSEYVDALEFARDRPVGPLGQLTLRRICRAVESASEWIETDGVRAYLSKNRITPDEEPAAIRACRRWLGDFCLGGEADSIPSYFISERPGTTQTEYQTRFKNLMDSVTRKALGKVRQSLSEDSTIWPLGDYLTDEQ